MLDNPYQLEKVWLKGDPDQQNRLGGLVLDAKQRVIWSPTITVRTYAGDDATTGLEKYNIEQRNIICAEPSPDALSSIAATLDARGSFERVTGTGASSEAQLALQRTMTETAQALGERTQVIQLLRDTLYRACEAFANGALDEFGYSLILGQLDLFMLELISADSLGRTQGRGAVAEQRALVAGATADLAAENAKVAVAKKALGEVEDQGREIAAAKQDVATLNGQINILTAQKTALQREIDDLEAVLTGAEGTHTQAKLDAALKQAEASEAALAQKNAEVEAEKAQGRSGDLTGLAGLQSKAQSDRDAYNTLKAERATKMRELADKRLEMETLETRLAARNALKADREVLSDRDVPTTGTAQKNINDALNAVTTKKADLAKAQAALAEVTGSVGPGSTENEVFEKLIEKAFAESKTGGGRAAAAACLQWFARHPKLNMSFTQTDKKVAPVFSPGRQLPAIAIHCTALLGMLNDGARLTATTEARIAVARAEAENDLTNARAEEARARAAAIRGGFFFN